MALALLNWLLGSSVQENVNNRDIILKSAGVKLPSWGAWDILKAMWLS